MKAIQIEAFGNPAEVMKLVDVPDVGAPGDSEVVIALEASPINMSDLLMISGRYGYRPKLPAIVGTEGVGRIVAPSTEVLIDRQPRFPLTPEQNGTKPISQRPIASRADGPSLIICSALATIRAW